MYKVWGGDDDAELVKAHKDQITDHKKIENRRGLFGDHNFPLLSVSAAK